MRTYQLWMASLLLFAAACSSPDESKPKPLQPASVQAFLATPAEVIEGDPIILSWDTKNTIRVRIEDARGTVLFNGNRPEGTFSVVPQSTTMYRLFASGRDGTEVSQQVAVKTLSGPGPDATFKIEPAEVPIGSPIHLVWDTSGTTQVRIRREGKIIYESSRLLSGTIEIPADDSAIYQFTAEGRWGKRELSAEVKVKPVILSFSGGTSAPVQKGTETSVSWKTRGANELVVRTPEGQSWPVPVSDIDAGSMLVTMGDSGRFELVAKRGEFEVVQTQDVAPLGSPRINGLVASPSPITEGELFTVTVSWDVDWALGGTLSWDGNVHEISWLDIEAGSLDIQVSTETSIVLQARNHIGTSSTTYVLPTIPEPRPALQGPKNVGPDELFSLHWNAPHASEVFLFRDGQPLDIPSDQIAGRIDQLQIQGTTTWTLEARNPVGSVRTSTHTARIGAPHIVSVTTNEPRYGSGAQMYLFWEVDGGTDLRILDSDGNPVEGCNLVDGGGLNGSCRTMAPSDLGTYQWTLVVENSEGSDSRDFAFRVGEGHVVDGFWASKPYVTTGTELVLGWSVLNDVDGTRPTITITDDRGGSWQFQGSHTEEGILRLTAAALGPWNFRLVATVPGRAPLEAEVEAVVVGVPRLTVTATPETYHLQIREPVLLEWTSENAATVAVFRLDARGQPVEPAVHVTGSAAEAAVGSLELRPRWPEQTHLVVATSLAGDTATETVYILVEGEPDPVLNFEVSATTVPRGSTVTLTWDTLGGATLSPFYDAPIEITSSAPFINMYQTGTPQPMHRCAASYEEVDEGCNVIQFADGFTFPFDGSARTGVTAFVNGMASAEMGTAFGNTWNSERYPSSGYPFANFGIFWTDQFLDSSSETIRYELRDGPMGRHMVVLWPNVTYGTYQMVFWESGALDYRYASVFGNGSGVSIGWQTPDRGLSFNLNYDGSSRIDVPGGLSNRSWRYFEKPQPDSGSLQVRVDRTTIFTLCAVDVEGRSCHRRTVTVQ